MPALTGFIVAPEGKVADKPVIILVSPLTQSIGHSA
jgi:hypothetical protein